MTTSAAANRPMTSLEWSLLLTLSVLWGGSFFFVGVAVKELPPLTIVVLRVALAALALHAIIRLMGVKLPSDRRAWAAFVGMGLLNNVIPFTLIVWGQMHIASGVASILNATTPLFTVIVAHFLTSDEKMSGGRLAGVLIGLVGVAVMIGGAALQSLGVNVMAQLACLAAAIFYALAGVFGRRFKAMGVAPMATATGQVTASSIMLLPVMLIVDQPWTIAMPTFDTIAALLGLALLSTAIAYILYFRILATAGATNLLLVTFLIPVSAILLGILVLGETLQPKHMLGMALIGLGLAAIDGRPWRALSRLLTPRKPDESSPFHDDGI
jgi:drug/metabolite transporter (DMT)-like permease